MERQIILTNCRKIETSKDPVYRVAFNPEDGSLIATGEDVTASDGFHTFQELYRHRYALFRALLKSYWEIVRAWELGSKQEAQVEVRPWRSKLHSDGTMFDGGYFIAGLAHVPGKQITYHLPIDQWDRFDFCETLERAPEWDGHTSEDVIARLLEL